MAPNKPFGKFVPNKSLPLNRRPSSNNSVRPQFPKSSQYRGPPHSPHPNRRNRNPPPSGPKHKNNKYQGNNNGRGKNAGRGGGVQKNKKGPSKRVRFDLDTQMAGTNTHVQVRKNKKHNGKKSGIIDLDSFMKEPHPLKKNKFQGYTSTLATAGLLPGWIGVPPVEKEVVDEEMVDWDDEEVYEAGDEGYEGYEGYEEEEEDEEQEDVEWEEFEEKEEDLDAYPDFDPDNPSTSPPDRSDYFASVFDDQASPINLSSASEMTMADNTSDIFYFDVNNTKTTSSWPPSPAISPSAQAELDRLQLEAELELFLQTPSIAWFADWLRPVLPLPANHRISALGRTIPRLRAMEETLAHMVQNEALLGAGDKARRYREKLQEMVMMRIEAGNGDLEEIPEGWGRPEDLEGLNFWLEAYRPVRERLVNWTPIPPVNPLLEAAPGRKRSWDEEDESRSVKRQRKESHPSPRATVEDSPPAEGTYLSTLQYPPRTSQEHVPAIDIATMSQPLPTAQQQQQLPILAGGNGEEYA